MQNRPMSFDAPEDDDSDDTSCEEMECPLEVKNWGKRELYDINPSRITIPDKYPRQFYDKHIDELKKSITNNGLLQPIGVKRGDSEGTYILLFGARRLAAIRALGENSISAYVFEDCSSFELNLIENLNRDDLSYLEIGRALKQLKNEKNYTDEMLGSFCGRSRSSVSELIGLCNLNAEIQHEILADKERQYPLRELKHLSSLPAAEQERSWNRLKVLYGEKQNGTGKRDGLEAFRTRIAAMTKLFSAKEKSKKYKYMRAFLSEMLELQAQLAAMISTLQEEMKKPEANTSPEQKKAA